MNNKLIIMLVVGVCLLLISSSLSAYFFMSSSEEKPQPTEPPKSGTPKQEPSNTGESTPKALVKTENPINPKVLPSNISKVFGWSGAHENPGDKNQTAEECRQKAINSNGKYVAWGYRNENHPDPNWRNTCFLYTSPFQPFGGNPSDTAHETGCLNPGEKVEWGCSKCEPLNCESVGNKIKNFYDTQGEWKNVFTMSPIKYNKVSATECDALYTYVPVPGGGRGDTGQDKRRFTLSKDNSCNWNVMGMGGYQSGGTL